MTDTENTINTNKTIGEKLKEARLLKGFEFEKITEDIRVKRKFLELLETNDFKALPSLATARGYMKLYGNYLGVNVEEINKQFNELFPESIEGRPQSVIENGDNRFFPSGMKTMNPQGMVVNKTPRSRQHKQIMTIAGYAGLGLFLLIATTLYFRSTMETITTMPRQTNQIPTINAIATPESLSQAQQNANKVYINVQALNKVYVTVIIDGRMFFKGMLDKDDVKSWEGDQYIKLKASAPRNLLLYVNGENRGVMGDQMTMTEQTYFTKVIEDKKKASGIEDQLPAEEKARPVVEQKSAPAPQPVENKQPITEETPAAPAPQPAATTTPSAQ